jgi:hypothetical protein
MLLEPTIVDRALQTQDRDQRMALYLLMNDPEMDEFNLRVCKGEIDRFLLETVPEPMQLEEMPLQLEELQPLEPQSQLQLRDDEEPQIRDEQVEVVGWHEAVIPQDGQEPIGAQEAQADKEAHWTPSSVARSVIARVKARKRRETQMAEPHPEPEAATEIPAVSVDGALPKTILGFNFTEEQPDSRLVGRERARRLVTIGVVGTLLVGALIVSKPIQTFGEWSNLGNKTETALFEAIRGNKPQSCTPEGVNKPGPWGPQLMNLCKGQGN